jgi:hypothetical protein
LIGDNDFFCIQINKLGIITPNNSQTIMHKLYLLAILLGGLLTHVTAQTMFTPGYIVTVQGDTIRGEIRLKTNTTLLLRKSQSSDKSYTPDQVDTYYANGIRGLSTNWSENGQTVRMFMREMQTGPISLYALVYPEERLKCAVRLADQTFVPLRGKLGLPILNQALSACTDPRLRRLLTLASFANTANYFDRVVQTYNVCMGSVSKVARPKQPFHYEVGLLAGAARNTWYYGANEVRLSSYWNPNGVYTPAYKSTFGAYISLMPAKRLSFSLEGLFTQYEGTRTITINNPLNINDLRTRQYSFMERYLLFPVTARYVIGGRSVRWYIRAGASVSYALSITGQYVQDDNSSNPYSVSIRPGVGVGYLAGVGAEIPIGGKRRVSIELRMTPHIVMDGVTRMANSRSSQLILRAPIISH